MATAVGYDDDILEAFETLVLPHMRCERQPILHISQFVESLSWSPFPNAPEERSC